MGYENIDLGFGDEDLEGAIAPAPSMGGDLNGFATFGNGPHEGSGSEGFRMALTQRLRTWRSAAPEEEARSDHRNNTGSDHTGSAIRS